MRVIRSVERKVMRASICVWDSDYSRRILILASQNRLQRPKFWTISIDINVLREFIAVSRQGSFAAASRALSVPKSTVSKRIQDLEVALDVRLFERSTRNVRLTAEESVVLPRAEKIIGDADDLVREVTDHGARMYCHLRICTPELLGQIFMGRICAKYRKRHPDVTLDIVLMDRLPDLIGECFDAAVAVGPLPDSALIARQFAEATSILVAAPDAQAVAMQYPTEISDHLSIIFSRAKVGWVFHRNHEQIEVIPSGELGLSSLVAVHEAAFGGAGLAYLREFLVTGDRQAGRLVRVLPAWTGFSLPLSIV